MLLIRQFAMEWKLYSRDRVAMFWTFAFPMLMLLGFGTIFRSGSAPSLTLGVAGNVPGTRELLASLEHTPVKPLALGAAEAEAERRNKAA